MMMQFIIYYFVAARGEANALGGARALFLSPRRSQKLMRTQVESAAQTSVTYAIIRHLNSLQGASLKFKIAAGRLLQNTVFKIQEHCSDPPPPH
jgi:hypothetical protein